VGCKLQKGALFFRQEQAPALHLFRFFGRSKPLPYICSVFFRQEQAPTLWWRLCFLKGKNQRFLSLIVFVTSELRRSVYRIRLRGGIKYSNFSDHAFVKPSLPKGGGTAASAGIAAAVFFALLFGLIFKSREK